MFSTKNDIWRLIFENWCREKWSIFFSISTYKDRWCVFHTSWWGKRSFLLRNKILILHVIFLFLIKRFNEKKLWVERVSWPYLKLFSLANKWTIEVVISKWLYKKLPQIWISILRKIWYIFLWSQWWFKLSK